MRTPEKITFPFQRGHRYSIGDLMSFEAQVSAARKRDPELSKQLRDPRGKAPAWMRLRNKELVSLKLFATHMDMFDGDTFLLRPEGDPIDADLVASGQKLNLQFTLAAPIWAGTHRNSGYQHHQIMAALNEHAVVSGYPPYVSRGDVAEGEIQTVTSDDRDRACESGLLAALENKALHDGRGCWLVIFAQDYYMQLLELCRFEALVEKALSQQRLSFDAVCVFDSKPGFFVLRSPVAHRA
jgi:hypothetical protein